MAGVLSDGRKVVVVLENAPVYIDVKLEPDESANPSAFLNVFRTLMIDRKIKFRSMELRKALPPNEFVEEPLDYLRVSFDNLIDRHALLAFVKKEDGGSPTRTTANDDDGRNNLYPSYYFPAVARNQKFNTAQWNILTAGKYRLDNPAKFDGCDFHFRIDVADFKPVPEDVISARDELVRDRTMDMTWDIETFTHGVQTGEVPMPKDRNWDVFMICATFHWQYTNNALMKICIVDVPTAATDDVFYDKDELNTLARKKLKKQGIVEPTEDELLLTVAEIKKVQSQYNFVIECGSEKALLACFCDILKRMKPDITAAFNGGHFDWPMVFEKLTRNKYLKHFKNAVSVIPVWSGESIHNLETYTMRKEQVKISPEERAELVCLDVPGVLDTDCMVVFKQLYPKSEVKNKFSLNFFLEKNKLGGKEDMPYKQMFAIYARALAYMSRNNEMLEGDLSHYLAGREMTDELAAEIITKHQLDGVLIATEMSRVAKYCVVDAYRCQQLYVARTIISDARELSNMSFVTLYDSFYRANGMKVRHLVGSYSNEVGVAFSNTKVKRRKAKYPGAYVFPPRRGWNKRPVVGLDFASLYPSLMMAYNLSPEKSREQSPANSEYIAGLVAKGYSVHRIDFEAEVNDETSADNGATFPVGGWAIRHNNVHDGTEKVGTRDPLPGERMGVFPTILKRLFDRRKVLKNKFVALTKLGEKMEKIIENNEKLGIHVNTFSELVDDDFKGTGFTRETLDIDDVAFMTNKINSKQKAMKVHMNTFYGEQGNYLSSIYKLLIAGAITMAGQYNIKKVAKYLGDNDYDVLYGDTDSAYLSCPERLFTDVDATYEGASAAITALMDAAGVRDVSFKTIDAGLKKIVNARVQTVINAHNVTYEALSTRYKKGELDITGFNALNAPLYVEINNKLLELAQDVLLPPHALKLLFFAIREQYWTQMVQITRRDVENRKVAVNKYLEDDNKTKYLTMAYEEVLFPVYFTGKKKYFGFAHVDNENFHPKTKDIFIKGIDIVKQGTTELMRGCGMDIIETSCSVENERELIDLVHDKIRELYSTKHDLRNFIFSKKYKPGKKNVMINSFVARMREIHAKYSDEKSELYDLVRAAMYTPPEPGDPFQYVVVVKDQTYDLRGRKVELKMGDRMEFLKVYEESQKTNDPMIIDMGYYMEGAIEGLMARFISYRPEFINTSITDIDKQDEEIIKAAKKYVNEFCTTVSGLNKAEQRQVGLGYRRVANAIDKMLLADIYAHYDRPTEFIIYDLDLPVMKDDPTLPRYLQVKQMDDAVKQSRNVAISYAYDLAVKCSSTATITNEMLKPIFSTDPNLAEEFCATYKLPPKDASGNFSKTINRSAYRITLIEDKIADQTKVVESYIPEVLIATKKYSRRLEDIINDARADESAMTPSRIRALNTFDTETSTTLTNFHTAIIDLASLYDYLNVIKTITATCMILKASR
jgi:DNA polymerase elongation subunit (family B)